MSMRDVTTKVDALVDAGAGLVRAGDRLARDLGMRADRPKLTPREAAYLRAVKKWDEAAADLGYLPKLSGKALWLLRTATRERKARVAKEVAP